MLFYYCIWLVSSFLALPFSYGKYKKSFFYFFVIFLVILIGLRFEVGGDWFNYIRKYYEYGEVLKFKDFISLAEPGYGILNYISVYLNIDDTILVNFICAIIFFLCLSNFSIKLGNLFFPFYICFTYTIIVVCTGYTRQSVAIGFSLLAFLSLIDKKILIFLIYIALGALFHKSILIFLILFPFGIEFLAKRSNFLLITYSFVSLLIMTILLYYASISEQSAYVDVNSEMTSGGVYMRLLMHVIPVCYYLYYRRSFKEKFENYKLFDYFLLVIIYVMFLAGFLSTLADRLNLFLVFFDLFVLTFIYNKVSINQKLLIWFLVFFSNSIVLTLWLNFGKWTQIAWIPYRNYISEFLMSIL